QSCVRSIRDLASISRPSMLSDSGGLHPGSDWGNPSPCSCRLKSDSRRNESQLTAAWLRSKASISVQRTATQFPVGEVIRMSLSVGQLEAILSESTEGFFDDAERPDDLRTTLRITLDIYKFFESCNSEPDASTIFYAMGTIQSGIDEFVLVAYTCRFLSAWRNRGSPTGICRRPSTSS